MAATVAASSGDRNSRLSFETAAQLATHVVPVADAGQRVADVRETLVGARYESASPVVVCESERFLGVMTIEDAFFIPGIVYLADAVGTQTETIVVRGLSLGVPIGRMVSRELLAGLAIGATLAVIAGPLVWWRRGYLSVTALVVP